MSATALALGDAADRIVWVAAFVFATGNRRVGEALLIVAVSCYVVASALGLVHLYRVRRGP